MTFYKHPADARKPSSNDFKVPGVPACIFSLTVGRLGREGAALVSLQIFVFLFETVAMTLRGG